MIRYSILKNGVITNSWTSEFADEKYYEPSFGKPDRWIPEFELSEEEKDQATDTRQVQDDLNPEIQFTEYFFPAEYELVIEDITVEYNRGLLKAFSDQKDTECTAAIKELIGGRDRVTALAFALNSIYVAINLEGTFTEEQISQAKEISRSYFLLFTQIKNLLDQRDSEIEAYRVSLGL